MHFKITDYHRNIVAEYYKRLIYKYGLQKTLKAIKKIKMIAWDKKGLLLIEKRIYA